MAANSKRSGAVAAPGSLVAQRRASRESVAYFVASFAIAWAGVLLIAARTGLPASVAVAARYRSMVFLAMLAGPSVASIALTLSSRGGGGLRELRRLAPRRVDARWYAAVLIAPLALLFTLGILSLASSSYLPPIVSGESPTALIVMALIAGLGAGFFEELSWTGFATPRLLARYSWPRAGLLLGVLWAAWHGLADYWGGIGYGQFWTLHLLEWFVALSAFRMLMTWVYSRTGSLLIGVLLHASFTGSQALLWPRANAVQELIWYGLFCCALWTVVAVVAVRTRRFASCLGSSQDRRPDVRRSVNDLALRQDWFSPPCDGASAEGRSTVPRPNSATAPDT